MTRFWGCSLRSGRGIREHAEEESRWNCTGGANENSRNSQRETGTIFVSGQSRQTLRVLAGARFPAPHAQKPCRFSYRRDSSAPRCRRQSSPATEAATRAGSSTVDKSSRPTPRGSVAVMPPPASCAIGSSRASIALTSHRRSNTAPAAAISNFSLRPVTLAPPSASPAATRCRAIHPRQTLRPPQRPQRRTGSPSESMR